MYAIDFEYDGRYLSDFGFIVCDFNPSSGADVVSAGSMLTFNTTPRHYGKKYGLTSTAYDGCIEMTFDICKNPDIFDLEDREITREEYRHLVRWLNRREFLPFHITGVDCSTWWFNASFNVEKIKINEILYGLELTMVTDSPFGYGKEISTTFNVTDTNEEFVLHDYSDEIGYLYPNVAITCKADGTLAIDNADSGSSTVIKNCTTGEVINFYGDTQIVTSSNEDHKIYNDFNFDFFKISNSIKNRKNRISASQPCEITITYRPIIKDTP